MIECCIGLAYFNDVNSIKRLVASLPEDMPIIAIDGRYNGFNWPHDFSTDGSFEFLKSCGNLVAHARYQGKQISKRNTYMEIAEALGYDFIIVMDSDDYIHPEFKDWNLFYNQLERAPIDELAFNMSAWISPLWRKNMNIVNDNTWRWYTRVFRPNVRYDTTHYTYVAKDDPTTFLDGVIELDGVRFTADSVFRPEEFIEEGKKWAEWNINEESKNMALSEDKFSKLLNKRTQKFTKEALAVPNTKIISNVCKKCHHYAVLVDESLEQGHLWPNVLHGLCQSCWNEKLLNT